MEFDADQLLGPPYPCAPDAISGDQKCKSRRDADRADYLERRSSLRLVPNETGNCAPVELNASGLQSLHTSFRRAHPGARVTAIQLPSVRIVTTQLPRWLQLGSRVDGAKSWSRASVSGDAARTPLSVDRS
jgi:hypothetical protein